jgi:hypothetical protein
MSGDFDERRAQATVHTSFAIHQFLPSLAPLYAELLVPEWTVRGAGKPSRPADQAGFANQKKPIDPREEDRDGPLFHDLDLV